MTSVSQLRGIIEENKCNTEEVNEFLQNHLFNESSAESLNNLPNEDIITPAIVNNEHCVEPQSLESYGQETIDLCY